MEKRSFLAIALSVLVLLVWSALAPKPQVAENKQVEVLLPSETAKNVPAPIRVETSAPKEQSVSVHFEDERLDVSFDEASACIKEVLFKEYHGYRFYPGNTAEFLGPSLTFKRMSNSLPSSIVFEHKDQTKRITKAFIFSNSSYTINLKINVQFFNVQFSPDQASKLDIPISLGLLDFTSSNEQSRFLNAVIATEEKTSFLNGKKDVEFSNLKFAAMREKYFAAILQPEEHGYKAFIRKVGPQKSQIGIIGRPIDPAPGKSIVNEFVIYMGPQNLAQLNQANPQWAVIVNYGTFDFIGQLLLQLLQFFYGLVHNWGWAIIILSIVVYVALYPLTLKQVRSMKEMQALQPKIEQMRAAYKDNPQRLNREIMELYKEHKVNPFGGCLPLLLQMPIFFALYQVLLRSVALKGAPFLWIKDLSEPDRLFLLPTSLPVLGNELNILPILMAIIMFFQQKMSMAGSFGGSGSTSAQQQKIMTIIFPIMFGFIFYRMPSGLVLYWFVNSGLMMVSQFWSKQLPSRCQHAEQVK